MPKTATDSIGKICKSMMYGRVEYVARFAVISRKRTKWVHKGCSGMNICMQYMSGGGTTCGGEGRGSRDDCIAKQHSRLILPPGGPAEFVGWGGCSNNINSKMCLAEI